MNIVQGNVICSECSEVVFAIHALPGRFVCAQCDRGVHSLRWVWLCNEDGSRWEADSRAGGTFVISVCNDGTFDMDAANCSLPLQWALRIRRFATQKHTRSASKTILTGNFLSLGDDNEHS